jgi:hypothetical protein
VSLRCDCGECEECLSRITDDLRSRLKAAESRLSIAREALLAAREQVPNPGDAHEILSRALSRLDPPKEMP